MKDRQPYHFPRKDKELISSDTRVNFEPRIKFRNDYSVANRGPSAAFSIIQGLKVPQFQEADLGLKFWVYYLILLMFHFS